VVQASPSSQAAVLFTELQALLTQTASVQGLPSSGQSELAWHAQELLPDWQVPPRQVSPVVQASPSSQDAVLFTELHELLTQTSSVQGLPSSVQSELA
jgi:hypothetical protein